MQLHTAQQWRCAVWFEADGAVRLVGDPGGDIERMDQGLWTLSFPISQTVFLESIELVDQHEHLDAHFNTLAPGIGEIHCVGSGTNNATDPEPGSCLYISLSLSNP